LGARKRWIKVWGQEEGGSEWGEDPLGISSISIRAKNADFYSTNLNKYSVILFSK